MAFSTPNTEPFGYNFVSRPASSGLEGLRALPYTESTASYTLEQQRISGGVVNP